MKYYALAGLVVLTTTACTVQEAYYEEPYYGYQSAPQVEVERPYYSHHHHHHGYSGRSYEEPQAYQPRPPVVVIPQTPSVASGGMNRRYHGHGEQGAPSNASNIHGHGSLGSQPYEDASNVHGHD